MTGEEREAIVAYRRENARQTLKEIAILIENELWNMAMNRLYYACFYVTSALLISKGIDAQTHAGVRRMLSLHFVKGGKLSMKQSNLYTNLFEKRQTSDYEDFIYFDRETVEELYPQTCDFVKAIEELIDRV